MYGRDSGSGGWDISTGAESVADRFGGGVPGVCCFVVETARCQRIARAREGESICTFARAIDCRKFDTWIVRAVYEELSDDGAVRFPVRPSDQLGKELKLDGDSIEEAIEFVAERAGRLLDGWESNPYAGRVSTVGDVVAFLQLQGAT